MPAFAKDPWLARVPPHPTTVYLCYSAAPWLGAPPNAQHTPIDLINAGHEWTDELGIRCSLDQHGRQRRQAPTPTLIVDHDSLGEVCYMEGLA